MSSKFNVSLIEEMKDGSRAKQGKEIVVSFEKETSGAGSFYRAGKDFNGSGEYLLEAQILENGKKIVKVLNSKGKLSSLVDGKNVKQDGNYIVFDAAEIKCLPNAQISIAVKGLNEKISTVDVRAGDLVINKGQKGSIGLLSDKPIDLELSENFFEDISLNKVKCGVLPAQAFEAAEGLKNLAQKVFRVNGEELKFLTINGNPNKLFLASGTEIRELANVIDGSKEHEQTGSFAHDFGFQFRGGDFGQGKVGSLASILENVSSDKANEILAYVESQNAKTSIERVSPETYKTKIQDVSKFNVSTKSQVTKEIGNEQEETNAFVAQSAAPEILSVNLNQPEVEETKEGEKMEEKVEEMKDPKTSLVSENPASDAKTENLEKQSKETEIKNVDSNGSNSGNGGNDPVVGLTPASDQPVPPNNPLSDGSNDEEEEETVEVVSEQPSSEEESKDNKQDAKEDKSSNGDKKDQDKKESAVPAKEYKPQYPGDGVHVPLKPLKVLKHCLFGAAIATCIALTVVTFLGGLLAPAFMFLSLAIGTATIMSSEIVGDMKERADEKKAALDKEQARLKKEIDKEKAIQKAKTEEKTDDKDQAEEKEEDKEEVFETDGDKKKKKKKLNVAELAAKNAQKRAERKLKVKESKAQATLSGGAQAEKAKKVSLQEKKVKAETKEKKSARELKKEAEKAALRKKIAENRTANYAKPLNSGAANLGSDSQPKNPSSGLDMGM